MTILYFTATGNSLSVAKAVGGTLKPIPQLVENNEFIIEDDVIGIIVPCFGFSIPRIVSQYLRKVKAQRPTFKSTGKLCSLPDEI